MRYLLLLCAASALVIGCEENFQASKPGTPTFRATSQAATSAPADTAGRSSEAVATVNGKTIYLYELVDPLVEAHGLRVAEMLIANELVHQEALRQNVSVTDAEVAHEHELSLRGMFGDQVKPDQRQRVLEDLLQRRGLTNGLWESTMRRNALLRKMILPQLKLDENDLKAEYARMYGEKVQASHIQLPSITEAEKIQALLKEGGDFADLAKRYSTNSTTAGQGGQLAPFSRDDAGVPQAFRDVAFSLKEGQVSGIVSVGENFHIVKVQKRFMPERVSYESVKEQLRQEIVQRSVEQLQAQTLQQLRAKADVQYGLPILTQQAKKLLSASPNPQ
jgi:foldase protein PrsA